jgi:transketolase
MISAPLDERRRGGTEMSGRDAGRLAMVACTADGDDTYILDSDTGGLRELCRAFPDRYLDLGIAEANLLSVAAGMASTGKTVFANTMAAFASTRATEQIKLDVVRTGLDVKIVASHAGFSAGHLGPTHWALEDIAIMRAIGGIAIVVPADARAADRLTRRAAERAGPVYLRLGRRPTPPVHDDPDRLAIGTAAELRPGNDVTIIATGPLPNALALEAHCALATKAIGARVLDLHTVWPLDEAAVVAAAVETGGIVVVEDHRVTGGAGGAVAELVSSRAPCRLWRVGVAPGPFEHVGTELELLEAAGVTARAIVGAAVAILGGDAS